MCGVGRCERRGKYLEDLSKKPHKNNDYLREDGELLHEMSPDSGLEIVGDRDEERQDIRARIRIPITIKIRSVN